MSPDWQVSSYEEVMPGDMARVTVVSSALTIGACDCCVIGWRPDMRHAELLTTDMLRLFSQTKEEMEALFTIYNLSNSCKNNNRKTRGREKDNVASCSWI